MRKVVSTKAAVALVRYTDVYPADRAFYEAGAKAKVKPHISTNDLISYSKSTLSRFLNN